MVIFHSYVSLPEGIPWLFHDFILFHQQMLGTSSWNQRVHPFRRSHSNPMKIPSDHHFCWLYILYIYIYTHYVILFWIIHYVILFRYQYQPQWKPLLKLHFPRCSYGFSPCFAGFSPIRSVIPGRLSSQEARRRRARAQLFVGPGG